LGHLEVLSPGQVLDDVLAVIGPHVDAEAEVDAVLHDGSLILVTEWAKRRNYTPGIVGGGSLLRIPSSPSGITSRLHYQPAALLVGEAKLPGGGGLSRPLVGRLDITDVLGTVSKNFDPPRAKLRGLP
jgi:hypothetical protein